LIVEKIRKKPLLELLDMSERRFRPPRVDERQHVCSRATKFAASRRASPSYRICCGGDKLPDLLRKGNVRASSASELG
jgi:hypothetical protein